MADISVGDITTRLTLNSAEFTRGMQEALRALQQFQQQLSSVTAPITAFQQSVQRAPQQAQQVFQTFNQTLNQTSQGLTQTARAAATVTEAVTQTTTALTATRTQAQGAGSSLSMMFQIAGGIGLATTIQGIVSGLKNLAVGAVETGTRLETMRASLSAIAGSPAAGQQQFQLLFETAQRLGVAFDPLAHGFRQLTAAATAAKIPVTDQVRLLEVMSLEARRTGASNEELGRAITGLAQMASKGKVSMEEMRQQIGEALPTAMAAAAQGLGRTTEEMEKMIAAGAIRAPEMFRAFVRGWEQMQQASGQFTEGSAQAFNRLATAWTKLQDTIMQSGMNTYLVTVANNLRAAVEWTTKLMQTAPGVQGPTRQELGASTVQQTERAGLEARLRELEHPLLGGITPQLQAEIDRTKQELTLLDERIRKTADTAIEERKVADATAKTATDLAIQRDHWLAIAAQMDVIRKARADFQKEAAAGPEVFGRATGTPDEQATFLKELQGRIRPQQEALAKLLATAPAGMQLGPEILNEAKALGVEFGKIDTQLDALRDKQHALRREASQAEQAPSQVAALEASLARVQTFLGRPGTSAAEQAGAAVRLQGAELTKVLEQGLETIRRNPVIQRLAPELAAQFKAGLAGLDTAVATQVQTAMEKVQSQARQQVDRLQNDLARTQALAGRGEVSAPELARTQVLQQGAAAELQLRQDVEQVAQSLDIQRLAPNLRQQLEAALAGLPEDMARQGAQAFERTDAAMRRRIDGMGEHLAQIGMELSAATLAPIDSALLQIEQHFTAMRRALEEIESQLGQEFLQATEPRQEEIKRLVEQLRTAREGVGAAQTQAQGMARLELVTLPQLQGEADASARQFETLQDMRNQIEDLRTQQLNQFQGPFGLGRVQTRREREDIESLTPENQARAKDLEAQRVAQDRLNYAADLFAQVGESVGSAWAQSLNSIASGTETVSEAFRSMAQSILQSLAQIASQEAWKSLISLGVHLIAGAATGALTGGPTIGTETAGGGIYQMPTGGGLAATPPPIAFAQGGVVHAKTFALLGEDPSTTPETVLTRQQMTTIRTALNQTQLPPPIAFAGGGIVQTPTRALVGEAGPEAVMSQPQLAEFLAFARAATPPPMALQGGGIVHAPTQALVGDAPGGEAIMNRPQMADFLAFARASGPSAGGQASGGSPISIHNYPSRAEAEAGAARERAQGHTAIVNAVLSDLSQGSGSRINRAITTLAR